VPSPTVLAIREVLRGQERPLSLKELAPRVLERVSLTSKKPEQTIRNALQNDPHCVSDGEGRWVYLPTFIRVAAMRSPVRLSSPETGELAVSSELVTLLWPLVEPGQTPRSVRWKLEDGPTVRVGWSRKNGTLTGYADSAVAILRLPDPFWSWWGRQRAAGANTLVVRCEDGDTGRYACRAVASPLPTAQEAFAAHQPLHDAAERALRRSPGGTRLTDLAGRLLARGCYHRDDPATPPGGHPEDPPPPFLPGLMLPLGRFVLGRGGMVTLGYGFTEGLASILAYRLLLFWVLDEEAARNALGLPAPLPPFVAPPAEEPEEPPEPPPVEGMRYTIRPTWQPAVWRRVELRGDQTLEDLHDAIQDAFGWDDRHLYAFFMSGAAWDQLTEIARPTGPLDVQPTADAVYLDEMDLPAGRHFLYVFDFGDDLRHVVTFEGTFPLDGEATEARFPRVVAGEGEVFQYGHEEEWEDGDGDAEEDGEGPLPIDFADFIDEGLALGLIPVPSPAGPAALGDLPAAGAYEPPDLAAALGIPTLTRFDFPPPDPRLRRLPVDFDQLGSAFVEKPGTIEFRLDVESGELLWLHGLEDDPDEQALRRRIAADPLRFARVPLEGDEELRRDGEAFLPTVADEDLQGRLRAALASTRPRRRYFDALARYPEEQRRWLDFAERRLADRVVAWLASVGVAPDLPRRRR
jgi:hypothetical protein